jgi:uncharacterized protein (DUF58 family)
MLRRLREQSRQWWDQHLSQFGSPASFRLFSLGRSPLYRALVFHVWDYPFTRAGKLLIAAFCLSTLPGAITDEVPLYVVPVALLALVLVVSSIGSIFRMVSAIEEIFRIVFSIKSIFRLAKCQLRVQWPDRVSAGQTVTLMATVTNVGWLPVYDLAVACFSPPDAWEPVRDELTVAALGRGESVTLPVKLIAWQRGLYRLPLVRAFSTFPFHLFRNEVTVCPGASILVLPQFRELQEVRLEAGDRHQPGGIAYSSQVGESPEYIGNRDYVPGDALRRIDFRSWARLARPIVREYQDEYYSRIALVMDTYVAPRRRAGRKGFADFEAAISLTAAIAEAVSRSEALIDIFAAWPELHVFRTGRNTTPFEHILEILAGIGPCRSNPFEHLTPALSEQMPHIASFVGVFLTWDESRRQLCRRALEANCRVKVVLISALPVLPPNEPGIEFQSVKPRQVEEGLGSL